MGTRKPLNNSPGDKLGAWTLVEDGHKNKFQQYCWLCQCSCGIRRIVTEYTLKTGKSSGCGCCNRKIGGITKASDGSRRPEYGAWNNLKQRCLNPNTVQYHDYGGRGITVCALFAESFSAFLAEIGERPSPKHTVDRIDNNRGYEPGNIRWATRSQQALNRRPKSVLRKASHME